MDTTIREGRAPMRVFVTNQPYILYETVELLRGFVNRSALDTLTMDGEYCLTEEQLSKVMEAACEGVSPEDNWLRHFFQEYPILDDSNQKTCLASCIAYGMFNVHLKEQGLKEQLDYVVGDWKKLRMNGYRFIGINRFGVNIDDNPSDEPIRLADELKKLPITEEFFLLLHETFSDLEYSVNKLYKILAPVAERLVLLLEPYAQRAAALAQQWAMFFQDRATLLEFLRRRTGNIQEDSIDWVHITLRYVHSRYSVGTLTDDGHGVGFHLGVGVKITMTSGYEEGAPSSWERELAAFKLLGDRSRQEIIHLLNRDAMTIQEVANCLNLNSGSVFRNINSMLNAELLIRENRGGRIYYRSKLPYIQSIFDHMMAFFYGGDPAGRSDLCETEEK